MTLLAVIVLSLARRRYPRLAVEAA
jgi:hypothetical protein